MHKTQRALLLLLMSLPLSLMAQEDRLNVKVMGRALLDAAAYHQNDASKTQAGVMNDGVSMRDIRIGVRASYGQWDMKAEASLNENKVSLKDVYLMYHFAKNHDLKFGNAMVPFGLMSAYGTLDKAYMDQPEANIYQPIRRIGIMHTYYNTPVWLQYGLFTDAVVLKMSAAESGPLGFMGGGRFVWRPVLQEGLSLHAGLSALYVKPESIGDRTSNQVAYRQSHLTSVDDRTAVSLYLVDAQHEAKGTTEALLLYKNFKLASQFYYSHVWRRDRQHYNTHGFYVAAAALLTNPTDYRYNLAKASVLRPSSQSLELTLGYGYLNLWDKKWRRDTFIPGMMHAGLMQDVSLGLNYFWNKHVTLRANLHHVFINDPNTDTRRVNVLQARLQYSF